jgi:hypothetical protein
MAVRVALLGVQEGLDYAVAHARANNEKYQIQHTEKHKMVGLPPGQILGQRAVDGFTM